MKIRQNDRTIANSPVAPIKAAGGATAGVNKASDELVAPGEGANNGLAAVAPKQQGPSPGSTGRVGPSLKVPGEPQVQNRSLAGALKRARKTLNKGLDAFATRGPDNAYPQILKTRRAVWTAVADVTRRHTSKETPELAAAIDDLQTFAERWQSSGDEMNMPRIAHGTAFQRADGQWDRRPGLSQLFDAVFSAAGMSIKG